MSDAPILSPQFLFEVADANHGPFDPASLPPPPEFAPEKPRPIPQAFRDGRYARNVRAALEVALMLGLTLCALSATGYTERYGYMVMGGDYAGTLGLVVLLATAVVGVASTFVPGRFELVRRGDVLTGRLLKVETYSRGRNIPFFGYRMLVEYLDGGERQLATIDTGPVGIRTTRKAGPPDSDGLATRERPVPREGYRLRVTPGDYVHLVRLEGGPLRIYGMLGLSAEAELLLLDGVSRRGGWPWGLGLGLMSALCVLAFGPLIRFEAERFWPIHDGFSFVVLSVAAMLACGAAGSAACFFIGRRMMPSADGERARSFAALGLLVLGAVGYFLPLAVNVLADKSQPEFELVQLADGSKVQQAFFNSYYLHYRRRSGGLEEKYPLSPRGPDVFRTGQPAALELHPGALGWWWIRQVHPIRPRFCSPGEGRFAKWVAGRTTNAWYRPVVLRMDERYYTVLEEADADWVWQTWVDTGVVVLGDPPPGS